MTEGERQTRRNDAPCSLALTDAGFVVALQQHAASLAQEFVRRATSPTKADFDGALTIVAALPLTFAKLIDIVLRESQRAATASAKVLARRTNAQNASHSMSSAALSS